LVEFGGGIFSIKNGPIFSKKLFLETSDCEISRNNSFVDKKLILWYDQPATIIFACGVVHKM